MIRIDASFHEIQGEGLDFWKRDLYEGAVKSEFSGELYPGRAFFFFRWCAGHFFGSVLL